VRFGGQLDSGNHWLIIYFICRGKSWRHHMLIDSSMPVHFRKAQPSRKVAILDAGTYSNLYNTPTRLSQDVGFLDVQYRLLKVMPRPVQYGLPCDTIAERLGLFSTSNALVSSQGLLTSEDLLSSTASTRRNVSSGERRIFPDGGSALAKDRRSPALRSRCRESGRPTTPNSPLSSSRLYSRSSEVSMEPRVSTRTCALPATRSVAAADIAPAGGTTRGWSRPSD
jgi:hypothetical protein